MTVHEYDLKGYELLKKGDWDAAIEWYITALAEHSDDSYLIRRRCNAWVRKGEPEKALAEYTRRTEKYPQPCAGRADAFHDRGVLYQELGEYDKAIADFTECIPMSGINYGVYWTNRGIAYREKGDLDAALRDMNAAMEAWIEPDCTGWTLYQRSLVWQEKGEPGKALVDLTQATVNDPKDHEAFYHLGYFWFNRNEPEKAIRAFSKALELKDDDAYYWLGRGVCYWNTCVRNKTGFWDEGGETINMAEADFTRAIECAPDMADAYFNRGMVRCSKARESNNLIKAIVAQKATDEAERVIMLAQLDRIGGKDLIPQADAVLRGLRGNRDQADVLMAQGAGLFAEHDAREAVEDLTRAITLDPENAEAYYQRGLAYSLLGEPAKALADYEQTCALDPDHVKAAGKRDEQLGGK
jgi:tetratricopeptide (TPR) repeat protein